MSKKNKKNGQVEGKIRISFFDDLSHKTLWTTKASRRRLVLIGVSTFLLLGVIFWFTVAYTPLRSLIPGYPDARSRKAAIENALKIDSLELAMSRWALYVGDLRRVLEGQPSMGIDSIVKLSSRPVPADVASKDSLLRAEVTREEQFSLSSRKNVSGIDGMHFFLPVTGVVSMPFDPITHPYLELSVPENSTVKAVLDGVVIFSNYSEYEGYSVIIQHEANILSIYKHCDRVLCQTGDAVSAGRAIAFAGGGSTPLHFSLWNAGETINPRTYINF